MALRNNLRHFFCANYFMSVLLISNHTVFLVQFEINLHLSEFFRKLKLYLLKQLMQFQLFEKLTQAN